MSSSRLRLWVLLVGIAALALSGWVAAEPPSRAARLSYIGGSVSFSPAGQPDWLRAVVNRPLTTGDRLWVAANSRAELQVGGASIRLGAATSVTLLNLDNRIAQVQLSQGTLKLRVRRMGPKQAFEVDTPNLAFSIRRPGEYRIDVNPNDDATAVTVQSGRAEV
ncbi:MAG: FecR domain-containing protein, partial [Sulfuricaulis sp.]|nr:FecR domain-containing protein [Sulfuricaulis sp.]